MLNSLPISRKLAGAFGLVVLIAGAAMSFVFVTAQHVGELAKHNERVDAEQSLAAKAEGSLLRALAHFRAFQAGDGVGHVVAYRESYAEYQKSAGELEPLLDTPEDANLLAGTRAAAEKWHSTIAEPAIERFTAGQPDAFRGVKAEHGAEDIITGAEKLREAKHSEVQKSLAEIETASQREDTVIIGGSLLTLIAVIALWLALRVQIGRPVVAMTGVMNSLAGGNNEVHVPDTERGDEIGDMARAVLVFRDNAIAKEAADRAKAIADAEQAKVVETLADGLGKLADGDLTASIGSDFPASYSGVRDSFNSALDSLRSLIGSVMEGADAIRSGSAEIAQAAEELATRTQGNAASLEESTAAIGQMNDRLRASADAAHQTTERAGEAIGSVGRGREVTDGAVQAMNRVSESAQGIDDVIEGLDKIAFQTRVLAMNAAVEAGRAGEAGRGFAVVADLVSALAMRAEEEAKRAREQLTATRGDIVTAVGAVREVDDALQSISEGVGVVHGLVRDMEADNRAQSTAVSEISSAVQVMDQSTQKNAAMVEETSAASRMLSNEVRALAEQANRFRIVPSAGARAMPRSEVQAATVH